MSCLLESNRTSCIPLPLCSCGVIPTAIGLKNEKASKGACLRYNINPINNFCSYDETI